MSHSPSRRYFPLLLTTLFILLYGIPDLYGFMRLGVAYTPFSVSENVSAQTYDETQLYAPVARRFAETGMVTAEADIYELRGESSAYPILHSIIVGGMGRALGSFDLAWSVAHAVFPALVWLVLFGCARRCCLTEMSAALLAASVCLIGFGPRNFFLIGQWALVQPLELARTPQPSLSFLILALSLWAIELALVSKRILLSLLAGIALAINFYSYYFYWVALGLGFSVWLGTALVLSRHDDLRVFLIVGLASALFAAPYLFTVVGLRGAEHNLALMGRVGSFTRELNVNGLLLAFILGGLAISAYAWKFGPPLLHVFVFVSAGAALGLNFQVFTGYDAQHGHFYNRIMQPLVMFAIGVAVLPAIQKAPRWRELAVVALLGMIGLAGYRQARAASAVLAYHDRTHSPVGLVDHLKTVAPSGSTIGCSDTDILMVMPAESSFWNFVPYGDRTLASNKEILLRYLILRKIEGASEADVRRELSGGYPSQKPNRDLNYHLFLYRLTSDEILSWISELWESLDLDARLRDRKLDLVVSRNETLPSEPLRSVRFTKIASFDGWNVFKVNQRDAERMQ
jgi:hypothetical protein